MLELASVAFNRPKLIAEQIRLLRKYLRDPFNYTVVDASSDPAESIAIEQVCREGDVGYRGAPSHEHVDALNFAWTHVLKPSGSRYVGTLDHDVFPTRPTRIVKLIRGVGFYGIGQRHAPTGRLYLWPGFCFLDRDWLAGREPNFDGIRDGTKRNDGDTGSAMWELFENEDWDKLYRSAHGYQAIREPDEHGLQSWGVELLGEWLHFSNGSGWKDVPDPDERDRLLLALIAEL